MFDRGHVFRLFSRLPAHFASQSDAPVGAPRQFRSTEHLSTEAIAAYVDGELRMNAYMRAATHLSQCVECVAEVDAQRQARDVLQNSHPIDPPTSLLGRLTQIPFSPLVQCDEPGACDDPGPESQGPRNPWDGRRRR